MVNPISIDPQAIYDDGAISIALGLPSATLIQARRKGKLRYSRKGKRIFYLGQWLLDWLNADCRQEVAPCND